METVWFLTPWVLLAIAIIAMIEGAFRITISPRDDSRKVVRRVYWASIGFAAIAIWLVGVLVSTALHPILGLIVAGAAAYAFIDQGLEEVKADPPHVIVVTLLKSPTNAIKRAGWRFLPFKGLLFGGLPVEVTMVNEDIGTPGGEVATAVDFFTADKVHGWAPLSFSYKPMAPVHGRTVADLDGNQVIPLRNFIAVGKQSGVRDILDDKAVSAFVNFMAGLPTWEDALKLDNGAISKLVKAIAGGDGLEDVPSSVPTDLLLKHFGINKDPYTAEELKKYPNADTPTALNTKIADLIATDATGMQGTNAVRMVSDREANGEHPPTAYRDFLEFFLLERKKKLDDLQAGKGCIDIPAYGITLTKVNIGDRSFDQKVLDAASQKTRELSELEAEKVQADARRDRARELYKEDGFEGTIDDAYKLLLADAGKADTKIESFEYKVKITADENTAKAVSNLGPAAAPIAAAVANKLTGTGKPGKKSGGKGGQS